MSLPLHSLKTVPAQPLGEKPEQISRIVGFLSVILMGLTLFSVQPLSAQTVASNPLPDMNGIWQRKPGEGSLFVPILPPGSKGEENPPYNAEWDQKYQAIRVRNRGSGEPYDPTIQCLPSGMPRMMGMQYPMQLIMNPGQVVMIVEFFNQLRFIYTDGRSHPPADELDPTFRGHSIGHWEGQTLVIDTVGLRTESTLSRNGVIHSDKLRIIERLRKLGPDELELQITAEDPVAFTKPWSVTRHYVRSPPGTEIMEFVCAENSRTQPTATPSK